MIPPALNWDLGVEGFQDLPHKAQTVFPLLSPTMVTHGPAPDHLPLALIKAIPGGAWEFLRILKGRSISIDLMGFFCHLRGKIPSCCLTLVEGVMACVGVTLPRTVTGPS